MCKSLYLSLLVVGVSAVMTACSSSDDNGVPGEGEESVLTPYSVTQVKTTERFDITDEEVAANEAVNSFAYKFALASLSDQSATENKSVAVSPLGVTMALGLAANTADVTVEESVCTALGVESLTVFNSLNTKLMSYLGNPKQGGAVELANSVWYSDRVTPSADYVKSMNEVYFADINSADLSTREGLKIIDTWVSEKTHEMIPSISECLNPSSSLMSVLVNALYFAGEWEHKFDSSLTEKDTFNGENGETECEMMHNHFLASYRDTELYEVVEFNFKGSSEITLVLPHEETSLAEVREAMGSGSPETALYGSQTVDLYLGLPKFTIDNIANLDVTLEKMGVHLSPANLEKMGLDAPMYGKLSQKDRIIIDEEGAKLAAAIFITYDSAGNPQEPSVVNVTFDRPFIFFVHNRKTRSIIMAGQVTKP